MEEDIALALGGGKDELARFAVKKQLLLKRRRSEIQAKVVSAAFLLGVLRSGFLYRSRPLRGLAIESLLLSAGFVLAAILDGYGPFHTALAVWGFFLIQSLYFLVGGIEPRVETADDIDPFVKAREEALRLMEDPSS